MNLNSNSKNASIDSLSLSGTNLINSNQ